MTTGIFASSHEIQVGVRRVRAEDWQLVRCVRLAALADAPSAFERTLEEELAMPDGHWEQSAANYARGDSSSGFLAMIGEVPCGFVVGVLSEPQQAELFALWVAGNVRRRNIGRSLVQAVSEWATQRGAVQLSLRVVAANSGAVGLYRAQGFAVEAGASGSCGSRRAPALRMHKRL